ncbi:hypothetical protein [Neorhizobium sp. T7_12]|uniref:hypothetical protein n=1 Tax=Neorhizobium sp. T7_12 TaxID=2093832 RepID=UPI000CFA41C4|nr:hypothetical protein [Neorhizobium sp. T7_12]
MYDVVIIGRDSEAFSVTETMISPPDSVMATVSDWNAAGAEYGARLPGIAETFEPEPPGMHTTRTVDHVVLAVGGTLAGARR